MVLPTRIVIAASAAIGAAGHFVSDNNVHIIILMIRMNKIVVEFDNLPIITVVLIVLRKRTIGP